jgi:hypothetical protein
MAIIEISASMANNRNGNNQQKMKSEISIMKIIMA